MKYFVNKYLLCLLILLCSGCCVIRVSELTPFPPEPSYRKHNQDPILSYNKSNKSFVVTDVMVENAAKDKLYLEAIREWKTYNNLP